MHILDWSEAMQLKSDVDGWGGDLHKWSRMLESIAFSPMQSGVFVHLVGFFPCGVDDKHGNQHDMSGLGCHAT